MNKYIMSTICLTVAVSLLAASCSKATEKTADNFANSGHTFEGQSITVLLEEHPTSTAIKKLLPEFELDTGIKVNLEIVPYSDLTSKALMNFSSRSGRYDIVMDGNVQAEGYVSAGYLEPLDSFVRNTALNQYYEGNDFVPKYLLSLRLDNRLYGLPVYGESTFLMYRKDLFEEYDIAVPRTLDELKHAAKTVYERTNGKIAGITLRGEHGIHNVYIWSAFLWGFGGKWLNEQRRSAIASPEAVQALSFYRDILIQYGPKGVENFGWMENRLFFQQGRAAMTIDATVNAAFNEDSDESAVAGKVGYAPVPMQISDRKNGASSLVVHGMYIAKDSRNKESAWLFMSWATSKEQQIKSMSIVPNSGVTSLSAMQDRAFTEKFGVFKDAMLEAIEYGNAELVPKIPQTNAVINNVGNTISKVLAGHSSPEQALQEASDLMNQVLESGRYMK